MRPRGVFKKKDTKFFKVASSENYLKAPNNQKKQNSKKQQKALKAGKSWSFLATEDYHF